MPYTSLGSINISTVPDQINKSIIEPTAKRSVGSIIPDKKYDFKIKEVNYVS